MDKYLSAEFKKQPIYKQLCRMVLKYGTFIKNLNDADFINDKVRKGIIAHKTVIGLYGNLCIFISADGNEIAIVAETKAFANGNIMVDKITAMYDTDSNSVTYGKSGLDFERYLNNKVVETKSITCINNVVTTKCHKDEELSLNDSLMTLIVDNMTKTQQKKLSRGWKK